MNRFHSEGYDLREVYPALEAPTASVPVLEVSSVTIPKLFEDGDPRAALCVMLERDFALLRERVSFALRGLLELERPRYLGMTVYRFEAEDELQRFATRIQEERRYVVWIKVSPP